MRKFLFAALVMIIVTSGASAQSPEVQRAAQELATTVANHEARITELEKRLSPPFLRDTPRASNGKRDYATAYQLALSKGLPLLIWHGEAICESCVHESEGEFINYVGAVSGLPTNAITIGVPENGEIVVVGVVDRWITSDSVHGHLPSSRRILGTWKTSRTKTLPVAAVSMNYSAVSMTAAPMMMQGSMGMGSSGGGCASCGAAGSRGGVFRRR